jgi:ribose-phosphate pyrophosphokinase
MTPLVVNVGAERGLVECLGRTLRADIGLPELREFPDAETYVRIAENCVGREVVLATNLHEPNRKALPLLLVADTLKDLGAKRVGLVVPYLPYMRQDARFRPGEGVTARYFARILSSHFDWLITCDPHLHRIHELGEIYACPALVVPAAPAIAGWIQREIAQPVLIGPDEESEQWVADVARRIAAPYLTLIKVRSGDRSVQVSIPPMDAYRAHTPVLIDDIVSTGQTFRAALEGLEPALLIRTVCIAVHAIFALGAVEALRTAGVARVVSCNTVPHGTNGIDIWAALAERVASLLTGPEAETASAATGEAAGHAR